MDDVQPLGGEQHPGRPAAGQMREQPGVAVIVVPGRVQRLLVDRRGDDDRGPAALRELDRRADVLVRRLAAARAQHAEPLGKPLDGHVDHPDRAVAVAHPDTRSGRRHGALDHRPVADHCEAGALGRRQRRQRLDRHLGTDPGRIAHGDDDRAFVGCGHGAPLSLGR
jgi:hypothetical protein